MQISKSVQPVYELAAYHPSKRKTSSVWETVLVGYRAVVKEQRHEDEPAYYTAKDFPTPALANQWLNQHYSI